jgi:hypothetical protein
MRRFYSRSAAKAKTEPLPDHVQRIHLWLQSNRCDEYLDMFLVAGYVTSRGCCCC